MIIPTETSINLWLAWDLELILQCPGSSAESSDESSHEKYALLRVTQWLSRLKGLSFAESPTTFETVFGPWFTVFLSVHFNELSRACQRWRQKLSISLSVTITWLRDLRAIVVWILRALYKNYLEIADGRRINAIESKITKLKLGAIRDII